MATSSSLYAIVIGISQYNDPKYNLDFAKADALSFCKFLTSNERDERGMGVPEPNIRELYDGQATHQNIVDAIEQHFIHNDKIKHGDPMLFYYSGHGARYQVEDRENWPTDDGYYETLVPADRDDENSSGDIPDMKLRALFKKVIDAKGGNLTLVIDCCHSGSIHRGLDASGAGYASEDGIADYEDDDESIVHCRTVEPLRSSTVRRVMERDAVSWYNQTSYGERALKREDHGWAPVVLAACLQDQRSWEAKSLEGGLFTRCLMEALASPDLARLTYQMLIEFMNISRGARLADINDRIVRRNAELDKINAQIRAENAQPGRTGRPRRCKKKTDPIEQTFQLEGWHHDKRIFDGKALGVSIRRMRVKSSMTSDDLTILMGAIHGVVVGTEFNIMNSEFFSGQKLGTARVVAVYDVWSLIELDFKADPSIKLWGEVAFWANHGQPVYIFLQETQNTNHELQAELNHALEQIDGLSTNSHDLDVLVHVKRASPNDCSVIAEARQNHVLLRQADVFTQKVKAENVCEWEVKPGRSLWEMIRAVSRFNFFLAHEPPSRELANLIDVEVCYLSADEEKIERAELIGNDHAQIKNDPDALYAISIKNRSEYDLWPTVFYFDPSDYSIATLYTPPEFGLSPLQSRCKLVLGHGGAGVDPFSFSAPDGKRDVGFLKIYLSGQYTNLTMLEQESGFNHVENSDETMARGWSDPTQQRWDTKTVIIDVE